MTRQSSSSGGGGDEVSQLIRGMRAEDRFFDGEEGIVAVFDFDYEEIASFRQSVDCATLMFPPIFVFSLLACYPCFFVQQIKWDTYSQHVAVTQDGVKYVKDKRKTGCGLGCQDAGKTSKTVPYDKITDCDVTEPAGATCCCIDNVLSVVNIDTASGARGGGEGGPLHELTLAGLKEPQKFKKLVWAMKRAQSKGHVVEGRAAASHAAPTSAVMDRESGGNNQETNAILRDIRSELIELNTNIKNMKN